jgi:N-acetylglucosaminyldiphosphoundecaprenol N-acetyl-beta-D-mannosaminyltransferase
MTCLPTARAIAIPGRRESCRIESEAALELSGRNRKEQQRKSHGSAWTTSMLERTARKHVPILGIPVSGSGMPQAVETIAAWIDAGEARYVCAIDVYNLMLARSNASHRESLHSADLVTADGAPISWAGRLRGHSDMRRVCGPDLMLALCQRSVSHGWSHYFFGGAEGVAATLATRLTERFPGLVVAGFESPPFRPMTADEHRDMVERMRRLSPNIIWVGLGCPKQEAWMRDNTRHLPNSVLIGVGAAFDFHSGRIQRAPLWMQNNGIEWLHRFVSEPRRLWRRYLIYAPRFVVLSLMEALTDRVRHRFQFVR